MDQGRCTFGGIQAPRLGVRGMVASGRMACIRRAVGNRHGSRSRIGTLVNRKDELICCRKGGRFPRANPTGQSRSGRIPGVRLLQLPERLAPTSKRWCQGVVGVGRLRTSETNAFVSTDRPGSSAWGSTIDGCWSSSFPREGSHVLSRSSKVAGPLQIVAGVLSVPVSESALSYGCSNLGPGSGTTRKRICCTRHGHGSS